MKHILDLTGHTWFQRLGLPGVFRRDCSHSVRGSQALKKSSGVHANTDVALQVRRLMVRALAGASVGT